MQFALDSPRGFRLILFGHEKIGGDDPDLEAIVEFNNCFHDAELNDLKWWGHKFTWWNKQEGAGKIECKLDCVLINDE